MQQLIVALSASREKFIMEDFIGSDNILALIVSGSIYVECGNTHFIANAGEGVLFRKNILYHRKALSPVKLHLFRYRSEEDIFNGDHIMFKDQARLSSTLQLLSTLEGGVFEGDFEKKRHLFSDLILQYELENNISSYHDSLMEQAIIHIRRGFHKKIYLSEIATKSGLSYVQFLRRFKTHTGCTPSEYIIALRLQKAKDMLSNTRLPVQQIAYACGFENEYYFSNFFKRHTSLSPSAFRSSSSLL
jgi:AraC-like DNA-binding protein